MRIAEAAGSEVALSRNRSIWAEIQRERAKNQRQQQQAQRAAQQAAIRAAREQDQARRRAASRAAANERERNRLHIEDRKASTALMAADLDARITELDSVLIAGTGNHPALTFASLKRANAVAKYNAEIDQFQQAFRAGEPEAITEFCTLVLDSSTYPEGFAHRTRLLYRPDPKEVIIEYELPSQAVVPAERGYRYVQTNDEILPVARPVKEIKDRYARLIAQVALRTIHEVFAADPAGVTAMVTFNGHVSTKDPATGQPVRPCLISVAAPRELFGTFVLADLDPVACLRRLNALVSNHPYDLEAVRPVVDFEMLLSQYKFVDGMDAIAALDSRRDLLNMTPTEFEHLVRQLFEAMGMKA